MKHHKNSRDGAAPAQPSQQQTQIAAAFLPAPWQQDPFSNLCSFASTLPAAPQTSPRYVVLRMPAVTIENF
jgi:hypothetical protein